MSNFKELEGKILTNVKVVRNNIDSNDEIIFTCEDGVIYRMYHYQDCCENVVIDDIVGDWNDVLNTKILLAEERSNGGECDWGSETWTFYSIRTIKGSVNLKWYGESNGYYSEEVYFEKVITYEN